MPAESLFFRSDGLRLHARRHTGGAGRPLVVAPGITTPAQAFASIAERLAALPEAGDVYVLDTRGRGLSERSPFGTHRAGDYAQDVLALLDHLDLVESPVLVGHSMGARVVASARARVPGCTAGVVAIDPPMSGPGRRAYPISLDQFLRTLHGAKAGRGVAEARNAYPSWTDEQLYERGTWLASCDEAAIVESYLWFHLEAFEPVWQEVEPPALLLFGDSSPVVTAEDARVLEQTNPRVDIASIAGAGHMVPWDNTEQTLAEITKFVAKLSPSA